MTRMIHWFVVTNFSIALLRNVSIKDLIKQVASDEGVFIFYIFLCVYILNKEPPKASNDISYHKHNDDKSEYLIGVHHHVLSLNTVRSS